MDLTDLTAAIIVALLTGLGARPIVRRRRPYLTVRVTVPLAFLASVIASLTAGAVGVGDSPGFEWVERTMQVAFAVASLWILVVVSPARPGAISRD